MTETYLSLAPLEGVTDRIFRKTFYRFFRGLDAALTPFLPIPDHVKRVPGKVFRQVALPGESRVYEIPQVLLSAEESFLTVCRSLVKAGYHEVNWNLGCPSRGVVNKGKGAGLMAAPDRVTAVLDRVFKENLPLKISLKIRTGMDSSTQSAVLLHRLHGYPLKEIICHPRLGIDMYRGQPDLKSFASLLEISEHPVVYNGDIVSVQDFLALKERFPSVNRWMMGRGLLTDPFLAEKIRTCLKNGKISPERPLADPRFLDFFQSLITEYRQAIPGEKSRVSWMKGILYYSLKGSEEEEFLRGKMKFLQSEKEFLDFLDLVYQTNTACQ